MLERRAEALREAEDARVHARRSKTHCTFFEEEAAHEQRIADIIGSVIPDEKTRRRPGFDINRWRDNNPVFVEIRDRRAREAKARRSSAKRGPAQR